MIQTITLEQAKRFEELGIKISGYWCWCWCWFEYRGKWKLIPAADLNIPIFVAPQAEEMLDKMPGQITIDGNLYEYCQEKVCDRYDMSYVCIEDGLEHLNITKRSESLSVAVGDMFIWLHENKYLPLPQVCNEN